MAKAREITASEGVLPLVEQGAEINAQMQEATQHDKAYKAKIIEATEGTFEEGETSIKVLGTEHAATISAREKLTVDTKADTFGAVEEALGKGLLEGLVTVKQELRVAPSQIDAALAALEEAGIPATITRKLDVKAADLRSPKSRNGDPEHDSAVEALEAAVSRSVTYSVKYGKK
jgi:hypothetical protein